MLDCRGADGVGMDNETRNRIADQRAAAQRADREATVAAQVSLLKTCFAIGAQPDAILDVVRAMLFENICKR